MIGAIAGDVIGSVYEGRPIKSEAFPLFSSHSRFTDDTVLTVATAASILGDGDYGRSLRRFGRKYPNAGYGMSFYQWIFATRGKPYNSWGNGSAMRVSPVGFAFDSVEDVLAEARRSAEVTHNHPEGVKGAQAAAQAIFLARQGADKEAIRREIGDRFDYDMDRSVDGIRPGYSFDVSCQGSVPESIIAFLDSKSYEEAVRKAVSLGGDSDTMACIAGGIAQAFFREIPSDIIHETRRRLPAEFLDVIDAFCEKYRC